MRHMTVGQVARLAGVGVETVRFYEKNGLLEAPTRKASGYRVYDEGTIRRLQFIQRAKTIGFTLSEIRELLSLRTSSAEPCDDVRKQVEAKITEIEGKVALLLGMKQVLGRLLSSCDGRGGGTGCLVLEALDGSATEDPQKHDDNPDLPG
jgi:MerR family transcriptional regulator, copper efflux regulator